MPKKDHNLLKITAALLILLLSVVALANLFGFFSSDTSPETSEKIRNEVLNNLEEESQEPPLNTALSTNSYSIANKAIWTKVAALSVCLAVCAALGYRLRRDSVAQKQKPWELPTFDNQPKDALNNQNLENKFTNNPNNNIQEITPEAPPAYSSGPNESPKQDVNPYSLANSKQPKTIQNNDKPSVIQKNLKPFQIYNQSKEILNNLNLKSNTVDQPKYSTAITAEEIPAAPLIRQNNTTHIDLNPSWQDFNNTQTLAQEQQEEELDRPDNDRLQIEVANRPKDNIEELIAKKTPKKPLIEENKPSSTSPIDRKQPSQDLININTLKQAPNNDDSNPKAYEAPPLYSSDHNSNNELQPKAETLIEEEVFVEYIRETAKRLGQLYSNNPVLFLGPTGAGKSTTICALLFGVLDIIEKVKNFEGQQLVTKHIGIKDAKGKKHPKIGHERAKSCTDFPECYPLKAHNLDLCDFAGLFDSNGIEKRAVIAITSKQFLAQTKQIKAVVFVMSQRDLEASKAHLIEKVIQGLTKMFANPLAHLDSIFFALTKSSYSPAKFRYIINEFRDSIKAEKDKSGITNSKTLCDLLDVMLAKHKEHFLVVSPLEEKSSKLITARLKQSKGLPSKAIRFIGDEGINRAIFHFFTRCAREGNTILDICNTYPKQIDEKANDIHDLSLAILKLSQEIDKCKKGEGQKEIFAGLLKRIELDTVKAKKDLAALRAEKAAKEKYIRNHDHDTLVKVGGKLFPKSEMRLENPWSGSQHRIMDISVIPENGSYCKVSLHFDKGKGGLEKENRSRNAYKVTYWCYEDGGSDLKVTLWEQSLIRYSAKIAQEKKRLQELKEIEIPEKQKDIAVTNGKLSLMGALLKMNQTPPNLVKELEAGKEKQAKDLQSLQNTLKRMDKELADAKKALLRKRKLFNTIAETHRFLGFTYGPIADFAKEYRIRGRLLTSGYIRRYTKGFPKELFNIILRNLDFI